MDRQLVMIKRVLSEILVYILVGLFHFVIVLDWISYFWRKAYYTLFRIKYYEQSGKFTPTIMRIDR